MMTPELQLWRPPAESTADQVTLCRFFREFAWPLLEVQDRSPRTRADYLASLGHWAELTGDPPLTRLSGPEGKLVLLEFLARLKHRLPNANTRHKHWCNVQRLLDWTGPASRQNPNGFGLIDCPPYVPGPKKERREVRPAFTLDELWEWIQVLGKLARPLSGLDERICGVDPALWWRAVILVGYNTGLRPESLFGMRWEHLTRSTVCPRANCQELHRFDPPRTIVKGKLVRRFWLNHAALEALTPLKPLGPIPTGLVFGWDWSRRYTTLKRHRRLQQQAAGIRQLPLYGLRRAFCTQAGKINPFAMRMQMGHAPGEWRVAAEYYAFQEDIVADCLEKLPQPRRLRQKELF